MSFGGANCAIVVGAVPSILTATDFVSSTLPAWSTERNRTSWLPSPVTGMGSVYGNHAVAPSTWNSVAATPLPPASSAALNVTVVGPVYHCPVGVPATAADVTGAVASGAGVP